MTLPARAGWWVSATLAAGAGVLACATLSMRTPVADAGALPSSKLLATMDWRHAGEEAFADLRGYLMVPTVNPPGDEKLGAEHLAALLEEDGIEAAVLELPDAPARANLIARLPASTPSALGALCRTGRVSA